MTSEELRALYDATTPGTWAVLHEDNGFDDVPVAVAVGVWDANVAYPLLDIAHDRDDDTHAADLAFVAYVHQAVPDLLEENARLRAACTTAERWLHDSELSRGVARELRLALARPDAAGEEEGT